MVLHWTWPACRCLYWECHKRTQYSRCNLTSNSLRHITTFHYVLAMFLLSKIKISIVCPPLSRGPTADLGLAYCPSRPQILSCKTAFYRGGALTVLLHVKFWLSGRMWLQSLLKLMRFLSAHFSKLSMPLWMAALPYFPAYWPLTTNLAPSTSLLSIHYVPLLRLLI